MSLLTKIEQDMKRAMLAKNQAKLDVLRFLKSALKYAAIEKPGTSLSDAEIMQVIQKQVKQRQESIQQFVSGGRLDLSSKEKEELLILEEYLPKQISDSELESIIEVLLKELNAATKKDFGRAMKLCVERLAGQADNKRISDYLSKILK